MFDHSDLTPPRVSQRATTHGSRKSLGGCPVPDLVPGMSYQMLPGATLLGTKKLPGKTINGSAIHEDFLKEEESTIYEITTLEEQTDERHPS